MTADGRLVRADREHEPDLFWALRGGGGSFGVVTAIEFRLFPVSQMYAGHLWYPIERGAEVLHAIGVAPDPDAAAAVTTQAAAVKQALAPWAARQMYLNFAETASPAAPLWTESAYHRLRRIKAQVDPCNMIRANHPVRPADARPLASAAWTGQPTRGFR